MLSQHKNLTYDEFLELDKKSDSSLEFIEGIIYDMASPSTEHQDIVLNLSFSLKTYLSGKKCKLMLSPYDIVFKTSSENSRVQPDLSVICNSEGFTKNNYVGAPTLVIEVLSPATRSKDYIQKMKLYMNNGVKEYWIVSPERKEIQIFNFEKCELKMEPSSFRNNEKLVSNIFNDLQINLNNIFE